MSVVLYRAKFFLKSNKLDFTYSSFHSEKKNCCYRSTHANLFSSSQARWRFLSSSLSCTVPLKGFLVLWHVKQSWLLMKSDAVLRPTKNSFCWSLARVKILALQVLCTDKLLKPFALPFNTPSVLFAGKIPQLRTSHPLRQQSAQTCVISPRSN